MTGLTLFLLLLATCVVSPLGLYAIASAFISFLEWAAARNEVQ